MFKNKASRLKILMVVMLSLLISACGSSEAPNPVCTQQGDFGDMARGSFKVKAEGYGGTNTDGIYRFSEPENGWYDTGIFGYPGKSITIKTTGSVDLCYGVSVPSVSQISPSPTEDGWVNTGIYINKGQKYKIDVSGSYSRFNNDDSSSNPCGGADDNGYWDSSCNSTAGRGLFAYIGNPNNVSIWSGISPSKITNPQFFELFDYDSNISGVDNTVSPDINGPEGYLYIKYADGDSKGYDTEWDGDYSDNSGGYSVIVTKFEGCKGKNGEYLTAYFGDNPPAEGFDIKGDNNIINLHEFARADDTISPPRQAGLYRSTIKGEGGNIWLKIIDSPDIDWNNDGSIKGDGDYRPYANDGEGGYGSNDRSYSVEIITPKPPPEGLNKIIENIINPIKAILLGTETTPGLTQMMYLGVTNNIDYILGIRAAMALAIIFFAFNYMVGLSNITQKELFYLILKLSIISALLTPTSWEFFNTYLFNFFINGTEDLIWITTSQLSEFATGTITDNNGNVLEIASSSGDQIRDTFSFLNHTITIILSLETISKLAGLFNSSFFGALLTVMLLIALLYFFYAILKALLVYFYAIIMTALLLFLAPLTIPFILFKQTKMIFDSWLQHLMSFVLQAVFLFMTLAIFNIFILSSLYEILDYSVCWKCIHSIDLPLNEMFSSIIDVGDFDKFCLVSNYTLWGVGEGTNTLDRIAASPVNLFHVLIFIILCNAMLKMITFTQTMAMAITSGVSSINLASVADTATSQATETGKFVAQKSISTPRFALQKAFASDKIKEGKRTITPNFLTGVGTSVSDGMGGRMKYAPKDMTKKEKERFEIKKDFYKGLNDDDKESFRRFNEQQSGARLLNKNNNPFEAESNEHYASKLKKDFQDFRLKDSLREQKEQSEKEKDEQKKANEKGYSGRKSAEKRKGLNKQNGPDSFRSGNQNNNDGDE